MDADVLNKRLDSRIDNMVEVGGTLPYTHYTHTYAPIHTHIVPDLKQKGMISELKELIRKVGDFKDSSHGILQSIGKIVIQ